MENSTIMYALRRPLPLRKYGPKAQAPLVRAQEPPPRRLAERSAARRPVKLPDGQTAAQGWTYALGPRRACSLLPSAPGSINCLLARCRVVWPLDTPSLGPVCPHPALTQRYPRKLLRAPLRWEEITQPSSAPYPSAPPPAVLSDAAHTQPRLRCIALPHMRRFGALLRRQYVNEGSISQDAPRPVQHRRWKGLP